MNSSAPLQNPATCQPVLRLAVYAGSIIGIPAHQAIMTANSERVVLASNKDMHSVLNGEDEGAFNTIKPALPCHAGTVFAHVAAGKTFRESAQRISSFDNGYYVVYKDTKERWLYRVMDDCPDRKDAILVCNHPDSISMLMDRIASSSRILLLPA